MKQQGFDMEFIEEPSCEDEEFMSAFLIDLSYSRLRVFMECRKKYYLQYVDRLKTDKTPALVLGGATHHALEMYSRGGGTSPEELVGFFMERVEAEELQLDEEAIAQGVVMLNDWWNEQREITPTTRYDVEVYFQFPIGPARMRGYIDRLEVEPREGGGQLIRVTDYKSGKSQLSEKAMKKDLQMPIYALAARKMFPDPNNEIYCSLYYLRSGAIRTVAFDDRELDRYERRISDWAQKVLQEEDFKPCWSDFTCRLCPFAGDYCDWPEKKPRRRTG